MTARDYREERFVIVGMVDERLLFVAYTIEATGSGSSRRVEPSPWSAGSIMKKTHKAASTTGAGWTP